MLRFNVDSTRQFAPRSVLEKGPERQRSSERPDNGSRGSRGAGPSSGVRQHNPHRELLVVRHAR